MIRSIAFDVFDTLYPTGKPKLFDAFRLAEQQVMREEGIEFSMEEYWKAVEKTTREIQSPEWKNDKLKFPIVLLKNMEIQKEGLAQKIGVQFGIVNKKYKGGQPEIFPDAREIIPYLHQKKILLSIISDTDEDWIRGQLKKDGLLEFFSEFYLSFQIGLGKGSGVPFQHFIEGMKKKGIAPDECAMIGDLSVDMEAKRFGMKTILYNPGGNPTSHYSYPPDYVIKNYAELKKIIEK